MIRLLFAITPNALLDLPAIVLIPSFVAIDARPVCKEGEGWIVWLFLLTRDRDWETKA